MNKIKTIFASTLLLLALSNSNVLAQSLPQSDEKKPIEITANDTLEWHRSDKIFIARAKAVATQGDVSIASDQLTAHYRQAEGSDFEIYKMIRIVICFFLSIPTNVYILCLKF